MKYSKKIQKLLLLIVLISVLTGCQGSSEHNLSSTKVIKNSNQTVQAKEERYDSQLTGVVKSIDETLEIITILDINYGETYSFFYNGATDVKNKYEKAVMMSQIEIGELVDAYYVNDTNKLIKLQVSKEAWEYERVRNLVIHRTDKIMEITKRKYKYLDSLIIVNEDNLIELLDLNTKDELTVKGIGNTIYSITITKGHGYIHFEDYDSFVGGSIEVGYGIIQPITEDMLIAAPEGSYRVTMQNGDLIGRKMITVLRDQEVTLNMAEFQQEPARVGQVKFEIYPVGATVRVNGKVVDIKDTLELNFGEHTIQVTLSGYEDYSGNLKVGNAYQIVKINLAEPNYTQVVITDSNSGQDNTNASEQVPTQTSTPMPTQTGIPNVPTQAPNNTNSSESSSTQTPADNTSAPSDNDTQTNTDQNQTDHSSNTTLTETESEGENSTGTIKIDSKHKIYIETPVGARVYFNGTYKGMVPISFEKEIGTHTIVLQKDGYETKCYDGIEVIDNSEDTYISLPDLYEKTK